MKQKTFTLTFSLEEKGVTVETPEKVVAFGQRLSKAMKGVKRDFIKKSRLSAQRASKIVLNA